MKTLAGAGVYECELVLASSVIFLAIQLPFLPSAPSSKLLGMKSFSWGEILCCFVQNMLQVGEERISLSLAEEEFYV
jgi:hypothetical protein